MNQQNTNSNSKPSNEKPDPVSAIAKVPIDAVKTTVEVEKESALLIGHAAVKSAQAMEKPVKKAKDYWVGLGPGLITGASDDDPSGIATYSQTGAKYGNQLLWLSAFTFPLMAIVQEMCARIGLVTGRGLAANIRINFPKWVLYLTAFLLLIANSFNIGADLGAMAKGTQLLLPNAPFWLLIFAFAVISLLLQIFISYQKYAKYLKYLALILFVYVITAFTIKDFDWLAVLRSSVTPSLDFSKEQIILICGILGTTISPYLFFWQTSQEVEEMILEGQTTLAQRQEETDNKTIRKMRIDVWSGMFLSNLVMFFIIAVCAAALFPNGINNIETAADAATALKPLAGNYASLLFSLGILGTGLLAIPVLAGSASYAIAESFRWKEGLYRNFRDAKLFYGVIILAMIIGLLINFIGINPMKALIYSAVVNGLVAPLILVLIVLLSSNQKIMGNRVNRKWSKIIGWLIVIIMTIAALATIYSLF